MLGKRDMHPIQIHPDSVNQSRSHTPIESCDGLPPKSLSQEYMSTLQSHSVSPAAGRQPNKAQPAADPVVIVERESKSNAHSSPEA